VLSWFTKFAFTFELCRYVKDAQASAAKTVAASDRKLAASMSKAASAEHAAAESRAALLDVESALAGAKEALTASEASNAELRAKVGRCTLTPPDPQLKGAWYPGGFNP
jgi:hypothetical protein